jgi:NAD(P) transhydrogenase subunit alpha
MEQFFTFLEAHMQMLFMLVLMVFVGIEVISRVPSVLHTPLMSGANAIHGVVIVGAMLVLLNADPNNIPTLIIGFLAVILGTLNVVGGFVVTDRMLEMFKKKPDKK